MDIIKALAIVISIMGAATTWAAVTLGSPLFLIWAVFIAWGSFFATGGTAENNNQILSGLKLSLK